ncbi:MAG TPA: hypothetical protein VJO99_25885 [Burkholderiaceae bacterium]|nr:hypothetical protein [Burkholderiaceae bacterium]
MEGVGPDFTPEDDLAITVFNCIANGMGGCDFGVGLDRCIDYFGVTDVDDLMHRLIVIKTHEPPKPP